MNPCNVNLLSNDRETVDDDLFVPVKWKDYIMLLSLAKKLVQKLNRLGSKSKKRMTPDLNVWVALHEQEVAAIQFVEDQLSEKEVASRASKKTVGKKI